MTEPKRQATVEERLYRDLQAQLGAVCRLLLKLSDDAGAMSMRLTDPASERAGKLCDRVTEMETELRAEQAAFRKLSEARVDVTGHGGQVT